MFIVWWYTNGLLALLEELHKHVVELVRVLDLKLLVRYLFVPMYGYRDIASRVISFFVRLVQLAARLLYTVAYLIVQMALVLVWCLAPAFVVLNIIYQVAGL